MHIKIRITMKLNSEVFDAKCGNAVLDLTIPLEFKNRKWIEPVSSSILF